ncbi:MAG: hypothetical protein ACT4NV_14750 [Rhodoferax sp.]
MRDSNVLVALLKLQEPWTLVDVRCDPSRNRCDTWIGLEQRRGWFSLALGKSTPQHATMTWRHTNLGDWNWYIHVTAPASANLARLPWAGEIGLPFTSALERQLGSLIPHVSRLDALGSLLRLDMVDLAHAYSKGRLQGAGTAFAAAAAPRTPHDDSGIPPAQDPVWIALLEGTHAFQVRATGLQLLLFNLRMQYRRTDDPEQKLLHVQECRRYFVRNRRQLAFELGQLAALGTTSSATPSPEVPA